MPTATKVMAAWPAGPGSQREDLILQALANGEHPAVQWAELTVRRGDERVTLVVATDAVKVGDATESVRVNVTPRTAQQIADLFGCVLPTTRICDLIWDQASAQLSPSFQTADAHMADTTRMVQHSRDVDAKLGGRPGLVANVGKDWVVSNRLSPGQGRAANYGWYDTRAPNQRMWQTLGLRHNLDHVDYSQVVRLVQRTVKLNGIEMSIDDARIAWAVSGEGPLTTWRIPDVAPRQPLVNVPRPQPTTTVQPALQLGDSGPEVVAWQRALEAAGYSLAPFGADGDFGRITERRTLDFQLAAGLVPDGRVGPLTRQAMERPAQPAPAPASGSTGQSLGQRCVEWCRQAMAKENPPSAATLALWFSHAERNGKKLGITRGNHCAIAQSVAALESTSKGENIPHRPRAAAKELRDDARSRGAWHDRAEVLAGTYTPNVGDLAVYDRSQPGRPETKWWGHVDRVSAVFAASFENIGANEGPGGSWRVQRTDFSHPSLLGFVAYPTAEAPPEVAPAAPARDDDSLPESETGPETDAEPEYVLGIDISHHNGKVDFRGVKADGFKYCFCKATDGLSFIDPRFLENWNGARDSGLLRGAYHFAQPTLSARAQAEHFFAVVGARQPGDLPPVLDLEKVTSLPAGAVVDWALEFMARAAELFKVDPILYTGPGYWGSQLGQTSRLKNYLLWEAHYTENRQPLAMTPWSRFTLWQFTDKGRSAGISTNVDVNRFQGSEDELLVLAGVSEAEPSQPGAGAGPVASSGIDPSAVRETNEWSGLSLPELDLSSSLSGGATSLLQGLLLAKGYGPDGLVNAQGLPDGHAGARTREYLLHFRTRVGLTPEPRVDARTWSELLR